MPISGPFTRLPQPPPGIDPRSPFGIWVAKVHKILSGVPGIAWDVLDKTGSKLAEIETRPHSDLQEVLLTDEESTNTDGDKHVSNFLMNLNKLHREDDTIHHTFEQIQDNIAVFVAEGNAIDVAYNDTAGTLTISVNPAAAQVDSTATTTAGLVTDFNALLAKLRTAGLLTP